jgi:hypothetical protein
MRDSLGGATHFAMDDTPSPDEIRFAWEAGEPIHGFPFLKGDPVRVVSGPHSGARGVVTDLAALDPEPLVRVASAGAPGDLVVPLRALDVDLSRDAETALARVQRWYAAQCDGDWEHTFGIRIDTLDNPGWRLTIDLADTPLEAIPFSEISMNQGSTRNWARCWREGTTFYGAGGPYMLGAMLITFLNWAESRGGAT